jgi:hypothetical protein
VRLLDGGSYRVVDGLSGPNLGTTGPPCLVLATKFGKAPTFRWLYRAAVLNLIVVVV